MKVVGYSYNRHAPQVSGLEWSDTVNLRIVEWCEQNVGRNQTCNNQIALYVHHFVWYRKRSINRQQSPIRNHMQQERSEFSREPRIALHKTVRIMSYVWSLSKVLQILQVQGGAAKLCPKIVRMCPAMSESILRSPRSRIPKLFYACDGQEYSKFCAV